MKELVTVLIPIQDPNLNPTQERMLHHCLETLAAYPIIFITYEDADLSIILEHDEDIDVIFFPKEYFTSRQSLSRLFLMEDFYDQFTWANFVLIHELNTWVIKDELYYWCKQGYDFLKAAPVLNPGRDAELLSAFHRIKGLTNAEKRNLDKGFEGNGINLCLVERMVKTLKSKQKVAYQYRHNKELSNCDAVFWETEANRFWPVLRKPTPVVQKFFARHTSNLKYPYSETIEQLPFAITGINADNVGQIPYFV